MNKKFIFSILIAFLAMFVYKTADTAVVDAANPTKRFSVEISFVPVTGVMIVHKQDTFILQHSHNFPVPVTGNVYFGTDITIDSVWVEHRHEGLETSSVTAAVGNITSGSADFSVLLEDDCGLDHSNALDCSYRILVNYTKEGQPYTEFDEWFTIHNPATAHEDLMRISPYQMNMVLVGNHFGTTAKSIEIEYKYDDEVEISTQSVDLDGSMSFVSVPLRVSNEASKLHYRLKAAISDPEDSAGVDPEKFVKYYPYHANPDNPSETAWITVPIEVSTSVYVSDDVREVILDNEDQRYGETSVSFLHEGAIEDKTITIKEGAWTDGTPYPFFENPEIVKFYSIYSVDPSVSDVLASSVSAKVTLYYGNVQNIAKAVSNDAYVAFWWDGSSWIELSTSKNNPAARTVEATVGNLGYFAVFANPVRADSEHRPLDRAFRPGELVEFRNLSMGDTVTIYNLRGQEISKVDSGSQFKWDGKRDGSYVETGSYIYQIKVKGKVISGSLVFYR
ncbi:MAG: hypothetical protein LBR69_04500 [Endomicrobium sp.]|jgi:hypothetical protein|nr:hypothetical protein [Endomicrobium sp.]